MFLLLLTSMAPKKPTQTKDTENALAENTCELTVASLESTLQKFFTEADKKSKERFEHLENQLDSIKTTLDKHAEELETQRKVTTTLQNQMKCIEKSTTESTVTIKKLQDKITLMEDHSRRNNLRIINLKEGEEQGQAVEYLQRSLPRWFPELADGFPELMRAHRIGPPRKTPNAPPRTLIVNFLRFSDRDRILRLAKTASVAAAGKEIRFAADYSDATAQRRRACYPAMNRARSLGFRAFLLYPAVIKLTRGSDLLQFEDPAEAAKFLDSFGHSGPSSSS